MTVNPGGPSCGHPKGRCSCPTPPVSTERADARSAEAAALAAGARKDQEAGPDGVCWEYQAGQLPIRLSFTIKVF